MGCGTSRPREMQVIHHAPWPTWYGGRVAPDPEPDESFHQHCHSTNWWFSDQLDLDESCPHPVAVPLRDNSIEPPPYTETAQNGHVSLMHGSPIKPADSSTQNISDANALNSSTLTANNISVLEASQYSTSTNEETTQNSSENTESQRCQSPFHPRRQSTPVLERRGMLQLPPIHRSRSVIEAPFSSLALSASDGLQHRHSIQGVPLALPLSLPPRLRPIVPTFSQESQSIDESIQSGEVPNSEENAASPFPVRPGRLPPLQEQNNRDLEQRLSNSLEGQNQIQRRKKKKRRRTHSWHGERVDTEIIPTIQEVSSTLSTVVE